MSVTHTRLKQLAQFHICGNRVKHNLESCSANYGSGFTLQFLIKSSQSLKNIARIIWVWYWCFLAPLMFFSVICSSFKDELLRFTLLGPKAHRVLCSALRISDNVSIKTEVDLNICFVESKSFQVWHKLQNLRSTASLTSGTVIGLSISDPRLYFPPKQHKQQEQAPNQNQDQETKSLSSISWPASLATSELWDPNHRQRASNQFRPRSKTTSTISAVRPEHV